MSVAIMARLKRPVKIIQRPVLVFSLPLDSIIESSNMDSLAKKRSTQLRHHGGFNCSRAVKTNLVKGPGRPKTSARKSYTKTPAPERKAEKTLRWLNLRALG